ncbi:MAG: M3 family oligoendopeptidase [Chloroflexi bacterium HGW-Chloroflexi-1]|nr:MAG: M3 family oligoendopeptidase [Chloroflexi bacterium HGW-Chloroflexi-1]
MAYPDINPLDWSTVQPHVDALLAADLRPAGVDAWLQQWSDLAAVLYESNVQIQRALSENTADAEADRRFQILVEQIIPRSRVADQALRDKLLSLPGYVPSSETVQLVRRFHAEAAIFRPENVPLHGQLMKLENRYDKITGGLSIDWDGAAETIPQASARLLDLDRGVRERAWWLIMASYAGQRTELNALYGEMLPLRRQIAHNAGLPDFRAYKWQELNRFDYTPADCFTFHDAIEHEVAPLARQLYAEQGAKLGVERLRPWDVEVNPHGAPLKPFSDVADLEEGAYRIFQRVDPALAAHFAVMRDGFLDLASRPNKAPGGHCEGFPVSGKPYIFMNAAGIHDDLRTLLHEGGHAFHFMESRRHPLVWNHNGPMEFCEVASMGMELLSAPYLEASQGGFYSATDARRATADHLRSIVRFLPYMAVVDAFQHWVYVDAPEAVSAADLDARWSELWDRFMVGIDFTGLQAEKETGWHRKLHIFTVPFYYVEYGLAQLGALQVWRNALQDQAGAVADYRAALALGNTRSLSDLFRAANVRFAFDRRTVGELMALVAEQLG